MQAHHREAFPDLVSYSRFVTLMTSVVAPLFVDSTPFCVCHRTFLEIAAMGRSSMDWFFGVQLHFVVNDQGELLAFQLTAANTSDRTPIPNMMKKVWGKVFGDKGSISPELFVEILEGGVELITSIRKTMRNKRMPLMDKVLLRKRNCT